MLWTQIRNSKKQLIWMIEREGATKCIGSFEPELDFQFGSSLQIEVIKLLGSWSCVIGLFRVWQRNTSSHSWHKAGKIDSHHSQALAKYILQMSCYLDMTVPAWSGATAEKATLHHATRLCKWSFMITLTSWCYLLNPHFYPQSCLMSHLQHFSALSQTPARIPQ